MQTVSWLVICGSGPVLVGGMYPSAIAQTLRPIVFMRKKHASAVRRLWSCKSLQHEVSLAELVRQPSLRAGRDSHSIDGRGSGQCRSFRRGAGARGEGG